MLCSKNFGYASHFIAIYICYIAFRAPWYDDYAPPFLAHTSTARFHDTSSLREAFARFGRRKGKVLCLHAAFAQGAD